MKRILEQYRYEIYKIYHSKLTISTILVFSAFAIIMGMQLSQGKLGIQIDEECRTLNGQEITAEIVDKMNNDLGDLDGLDKPENNKYVALAHTMAMANDYESEAELISADQFYESRIKMQRDFMVDQGLSDAEIKWWDNKEAEVKKPMVYYSQLRVEAFANYMLNICIMAILLSAICLSDVFAGEYRKNMDQLLFSCKYGRKDTFVAKTLAGLTFSLTWTLMLTILLALTMWLIGGLDCLGGVVQLAIPYSAYPLTFGQFIGIQIIIVTVASIMFSAMSMALSSIFKNGVAVMGVMVGLYLLAQYIDIIYKSRVINQTLWLIPTNLVTMHSLNSFYLIEFFGSYYSLYEVAPFFYIMTAIIFILVGDIAFKRSQRY